MKERFLRAAKRIFWLFKSNVVKRDLIKTFKILKKVDQRNAAEYAYIFSMLFKQAGNNKKAIRFGREAIVLLDKCRMEVLEDFCSRNDVIEGIGMPSYFHQDVVRNSLSPLVL